MIDIKTWVENFTAKVERAFGNRVWFIGLQGSYGRGEATDTSDIDVVVILDRLRINDLKLYRDMLETVPHRELVCGFLSGKEELLNWDTSDLFQFYHDTTPIKGSLNILLEKIDRQSVKRAIRTGACNIYHACVHNFVHERSDDILRSLFKSVAFVIQAIYYCETGKYIKSKSDLRKALNPPSAVLETEREIKNGAPIKFEQMSELILNWAKTVIVGNC